MSTFTKTKVVYCFIYLFQIPLYTFWCITLLFIMTLITFNRAKWYGNSYSRLISFFAFRT